MGMAPAGQIDRRVRISIGGMSATTGEHPISQRHVAADRPAQRAEPAGRVPAIRYDELAASPGLLVAQKPGELGPARIRNGAGQAVGGPHPRPRVMTSKELGDKGNLISSALSIPIPPTWGSGAGRRQACTGHAPLIPTVFPNAWTVQLIASS